MNKPDPSPLIELPARFRAFVRRRRKAAALLLSILGLAAALVFAGLCARHADRSMRADLLKEARLVAHAIHPSAVANLAGTEADLRNGDYLRLKEQLAAIANSTPRYRFIYLMGLRPDGTLFFHVDNSPPGHPDEALPGMLYDDAPAAFRRVIEAGAEIVAGPYQDQWGSFMSAAVPLRSPDDQRVLAAAAIDVDASSWRWEVASKAAYPAGLFALALSIGLLSLFSAIPRTDDSPRLVMRRLMPPLALLVLSLTLAPFFLLLHLQRQQERSIFTDKVMRLENRLGAIAPPATISDVERLCVPAEPAEAVRKRVDVELALILDKRHLDPEIWNAGLERIGRAGDWEQWPGALVAHSSQASLPGEWIAIAQRPGIGTTGGTLEIAARRWRYAAIPFRDARGQAIGAWLVQSDITRQTEFLRHAIALGGTIAAALASLFLCLVYALLRRTDEGIRAQQAALRQSEERNRSIVGLLPDILFLTNSEGVFLDVFASSESLLFRPRDEVLGKRICDLLPHPEADAILERVRAAILAKTFQSIEYALEVPAGHLHFEARIMPSGPDNALALVRDVTARKQTELALRQSEEQFKSLVSNVPGVFYRCKFTRNWTALFVSPEIESLSGYSPADFVDDKALPFRSIVHGDDANAVAQTLRGSVESNTPWVIEYRIVRKDGGVRWVRETGRTVVFESGSARHLYLDGFIFDVTDRKLLQEQIDQNRAFLETLVDSLPIPVYYVNDAERYMLTNRAFEVFFGMEKEELLGKTAFDCYLWNEAQLHHEKDRQLFWTGGTQTFESQLTDARGGTHDVVFHKATIANSDEKVVGIVGAIQDFTDRKRMEAERIEMQSRLLQTGKLEAVGQLAAGLAHEINTPIQFIGDNAAFLNDAFADLLRLLDRYESALAAQSPNGNDNPDLAELRQLAAKIDLPFLSAEVPKALADTTEGVQRVRRIVSAMRDFAHPDSREKTSADINAGIESSVAICRSEWKNVAEIQLDLDPNLPKIPCHPGAINQVLVNLVVNAAHAIRDAQGRNPERNGSISVRTRFDGTHVVVRVQDNGSGIPESARDRIFEPFFTTKEVGQGTGQGLYMARNIVLKQHGGTISFETESDKGTTFTVALPLVPPPNTERK